MVRQAIEILELNWKMFPLKSQAIIYDAKMTFHKKRIENRFQMNKFSFFL